MVSPGHDCQSLSLSTFRLKEYIQSHVSASVDAIQLYVDVIKINVNIVSILKCPVKRNNTKATTTVTFEKNQKTALSASF